MTDARKTGASKTVAGSLSPCLLVPLSLLAAGCNLHLPGEPKASERPVPADQIVEFNTLFKDNCAGCHGANGTLGPAPPLNDPLFRASVPEKVVEQVVAFGRPGTSMPAFAKENGGSLTAPQIQVLVNQIKGIPCWAIKTGTGEDVKIEIVRDPGAETPIWGTPGQLPADMPPYLLPKAKPGTPGPGDKERGTKVFARACAGCHGKQGLGEKGERPRVGAVNDMTFLTLISDQALRRIVITGRADLGMPDFAGKGEKAGRPEDFNSLTAQDVDDLVALLGYWRQVGPGNGK
jgi:mono/diheme cytochrome c family protein